MSYYEQSVVFSKVHVCGNDFCLINALGGEFSFDTDAVQHLGDRRTGVGFDQLILIERARDTSGDVALQFYNSDGKKTDQCGNGCAAAAAYLHKHKLNLKPTIRLETFHQITECAITRSDTQDRYTVDVNLGTPRLDPGEVPFLNKERQVQYELNVPSQRKPLLLSVISLGNPHAVLMVSNVEEVSLEVIGSELQEHESFPHSTNVEVLEVQDESNGRLRIFERGVGETRACGTGAAAAMVAGRLLKAFSNAVNMKMPGGSTLVRWEGVNNPVIVQCEPSFVFTGTVPLSSFS